MFQRKNQDILSEHYHKLVDYEGDKVKLGPQDQDDDDDDFLTLHRADHALESDHDEDDIDDLVGENISKRKLKMSKKERAKNAPRGEKMIFDEEGNAHQMYELVDEEEFLKAGDAKSQIKAFISEKESAMKVADAQDKELVKQKKLEKKIKRKERERAVSIHQIQGYYA
jgi:ATP-dependent RNA helicase DDX10/DBP4